jgi:hypothetical protein
MFLLIKNEFKHFSDNLICPQLWSEEAVKLGLPDNFIELRRQKLRKQDRIQPLIDAVPSPDSIPITSSGTIFIISQNNF